MIARLEPRGAPDRSLVRQRRPAPSPAAFFPPDHLSPNLDVARIDDWRDEPRASGRHSCPRNPPGSTGSTLPPTRRRRPLRLVLVLVHCDQRTRPSRHQGAPFHLDHLANVDREAQLGVRSAGEAGWHFLPTYVAAVQSPRRHAEMFIAYVDYCRGPWSIAGEAQGRRRDDVLRLVVARVGRMRRR